MDQYSDVSYKISRLLTGKYSTSFSTSSRLFGAKERPHIYAIYGMVRVADEIVDTYAGDDKKALLDAFERDVYEAISRQYSANPIAHAFALTARQFDIDKTLIEPFFASMRMDCEQQAYTPARYRDYIYGSAEVVGLMCLRVFCAGDKERYAQLMSGAQALGAAYQKVNFLRDIAEDYHRRGRVYFPDVDMSTFSDVEKRVIVDDIKHDFDKALPAIAELPPNCRVAVMTSYAYYRELLARLATMPASEIVSVRVRVNDARKLWLLAKTVIQDNVR